MKKQTTWFSHDATASHDPKLIALIAALGMQGYGRWWRLVEILRSEERYQYDITAPFAYTVLAKELMCTTDEAKQFVQDCIQQYQLLQTDNEYIWSTSLCGRMEHLDTKKEVLRERARKGGQTTQAKAKAQAKVDDSASTGQPNKTKQKETKQNQQQTTTNNTSPVQRGCAEDVRANGECQPKEVAAGELSWQKQKASALANDNFTYAIISTGKLTISQLEKWLDAFNRILTIRGEAPKSGQDYRMHFLNWFKFRDPTKEDPATFLVPEPRNKAPVIISTNSFLKTPQQIEAEQQQQQWKNKKAK